MAPSFDAHDRSWATTDAQWLTNLKRAGNSEAAPWQAPRLTKAGKPFEPAALKPGHVGLVRRLDGSWRAVQVWAQHPRPSTVWLVSADVRDDRRAFPGSWSGETYVELAE